MKKIIENIWFEFEEWAGGYDENDGNAIVHFELNDGTKWCAEFFTYQNLVSLSNKNKETGECLSGAYFYVDKPIFILKMNKELILSVLNEIIKTEPDLDDVFEKIE